MRACRRVCRVCIPLAEHQGGLGLGVVVGGRGAADEHGGPAVPAQRVLQDAGHLAVPVRHMGFLQRTGFTVRPVRTGYECRMCVVGGH